MSEEEKSLVVAESTVADSYDDMKDKLVKMINSPDVWVHGYKIERTERHPTHNRYKITFDFVGVLDEIDLNNDSKAVKTRSPGHHAITQEELRKIESGDEITFVIRRLRGGIMKKSTTVELVEELEKLKKIPGHSPVILSNLDFMIAEAKAGEYHDFKNNKYACGKVESYAKLISMGFVDLANRIKNGEFDESPDEEDKARMKKECLDGGFTEEQIKNLFGI